MNNPAPGKSGPNANDAPLPPWEACDVFCINDYASSTNTCCGWRGEIRSLQRDLTRAAIRCPRCGNATLIAIRPRRPGPPLP